MTRKTDTIKSESKHPKAVYYALGVFENSVICFHSQILFGSLADAEVELSVRSQDITALKLFRITPEEITVIKTKPQKELP